MVGLELLVVDHPPAQALCGNEVGQGSPGSDIRSIGNDGVPESKREAAPWVEEGPLHPCLVTDAGLVTLCPDLDEVTAPHGVGRGHLGCQSTRRTSRSPSRLW